MKSFNITDYIRCPQCLRTDFSKNKRSIKCNSCSSKYPIKDDILILIKPKNQLSVIKIWNKEKGFEEFGFLRTAKISKLVKKMTDKSSTSLDVGCGVGAYQKDFEGSVVSFDYIPYFVKTAKKKFGKRNRIFIVADINDFPFQSNKFDFELCSQVIEHFKNKESEQLLRNMMRTSKGKVIVDTPNDGNKFIHQLRTLLYPDVPNAIHGDHTNEKMLHHKLMSKNDLEKFGFEAHSCIGFVSRNRFRFGLLWDLYDLLVWNFPSIGGNLVGIYNKELQ